ncbi:OX-2 membrane glycoprotein-like [Megalobrama amblycephala]|uniref:OX-2 membrane glycoprotein-like n=1 Tax=Megalobrama amblycephala TaxID=75352 RepID=UPI002013E4B4|nr:OX-2 membrane glycoprotein-like [Megalobrama amblycephala]
MVTLFQCIVPLIATHKIPLLIFYTVTCLGDSPDKLYMYLFIDRNQNILDMLRLLIILSLLRRAYFSEIVAQGDTDVVVGQDASFSCTLPNPSGVKHVTWQRVRADQSVQILATFSERFQDNVDKEYASKVTLTRASFNSTSIEIKNTTFEDEACYICSFKVYPSGPIRKTMCLTVKGITEITAEVNSSPTSDTNVVVSCSATGKPAPTIQWKSAENEMNFMSNNFTNLNLDSSTTITSNITLPLSQFHGKYVECLVQSDNVEKSYQIYVPRQDDHNENKVTLRSYIIPMLVVVIFSIVVIAFYLHTKLNNKDQKSACTA